jgi:hypothetical protein
MTAFNFLSGSIDPNSLPALLRQKMAPGLIPGPVQPMPLASGFRAPALPPSMGFRAMPQLPPVPGFNVQDGPGILGKLLSGFRLPTSGIDPNSGVIVNLTDGLSGWGAPAGAGAIDPLTGLLQDLGFGGGVETGGVAGAAAGAGAAGAEAAGFSIADLLPFLLAA